MHLLLGTYAGIVEAVNDSEQLGRVKVRVPHVYGATALGTGFIGTNDLPWALPAGLPAGGSAASGGFSQLPAPGDKVWVRFLDGEPEKPIWEWGMQTVSDHQNLPLHSYDKASSGVGVGNPNRAFWTRYGHAIELNAGSLIATTSSGYRLVLTDASQPGLMDGSIALTTAQGNFLKLDDTDNSATLNTLEDCTLNVGTGFLGLSESFSWKTTTQTTAFDSGKKFTVTALDNIEFTGSADFSVSSTNDTSFTSGGAFDLTATGGISLTGADTFDIKSAKKMTMVIADDVQLTGNNFTLDYSVLNLGTGAEEPFVLGNQLVSFCESLLTYLTAHTHSNGNNGSPTGPPILPPDGTVSPDPASLISSEIFGR